MAESCATHPACNANGAQSVEKAGCRGWTGGLVIRDPLPLGDDQRSFFDANTIRIDLDPSRTILIASLTMPFKGYQYKIAATILEL